MLQTQTTSELCKAYQRVRDFSLQIAAPLSAEDCAIQSMPDVSPTRWHLAHTTWFFETFLLRDRPGYQKFDSAYEYLFNSYYNQVGKQFPRAQRGLISRPGLEETIQYRDHVDRAMQKLIQSNELDQSERDTLEIGLNHEQQHQELMLTDIKHVLSCNPTWPTYADLPFDASCRPSNDWIEIDAGLYEVGHEDPDAFAFDNESPRHQTFLNDCRVSDSLVTCGEYLTFIEDGGYQKPEFWLSLGWSVVQQQDWHSPLYWVKENDEWFQFTLAGLRPVNPHWPVSHVSLFEADAFARWAGKRLPTEFEWEAAQSCIGPKALATEPFADYLLGADLTVHPTRSPASLLGSVWQWTSSSYAPYPGYRPPAGAIGEYNGKFMCNQYVLRGGSVATSHDHIRATYRNFFPADARWQFSGIRLADD